MTDILNTTDLTTSVRRSCARLGKVLVVLPAMKAVTDTVGQPNSMNVINSLGLPVPSSAPTLAATDVGTGNIIFQNYPQTIAYYAAFKDANVAVTPGAGIGPPVYCGTVTITSASNVNVDITAITNEATNTRTTHCVLYRNLITGGTTFFPVATIAVASMGSVYKDNVTNATAAASSPALATDNYGPLMGAAPSSSTYGIAVSHRGFMFLAGAANQTGGSDYDDAYIHSKLNNADAYPTNYQNFVASGQCGIIRALHPQGDDLVFYKDACMAVLRWRLNPTGDGDLKTVFNGRGAVNQKCVVNLDGVHYVLDRQGIYVHSNAYEANGISVPLTGPAGFWERINWAAAPWFSATHDRRRIWFFVALDNDTIPHHAFVVNLAAVRAGRGVRWWPHRYLHGVVDSSRHFTGAGTIAGTYKMQNEWHPVVMTGNGRVRIIGSGYRDGVHPYLTAEGLAAAGATTTSVTFGTVGTHTYTTPASQTANYIGAYIHFPDSNQSAEITAQSGASSETLTYSTLAVAPATGERFWIGSIPEAVYKTPHMGFGLSDSLKRAERCIVRFQPRGYNHFLRIGFNRNRGVTTGLQRTTSASDTDAKQQGFKTIAGDEYISVFMGGDLTNEGRRGVCKFVVSNIDFNTMQIVLDASGVDKPCLIDHVGLEVRGA